MAVGTAGGLRPPMPPSASCLHQISQPDNQEVHDSLNKSQEAKWRLGRVCTGPEVLWEAQRQWLSHGQRSGLETVDSLVYLTKLQFPFYNLEITVAYLAVCMWCSWAARETMCFANIPGEPGENAGEEGCGGPQCLGQSNVCLARPQSRWQI